MRTSLRAAAFALIMALRALALPAHADNVAIHVDASKVVSHVTPLMTGSCIEDVNHEIYGGLYDQKIFGESFEEPAPAAKFADWTAYGGSWAPNGAGCRVSADPGAKLVYDRSDIGDGAVEADLQLSGRAGDNAGLLVRVQNPGVGADEFDGYEISLSPGGRQVLLGKHHHNWKPLISASAAVNAGRWSHLRVVLAGPRIRVYLDGGAIPAIDFADTASPLLSGKIALRTWNADASFRGVSVQTGAGVVDARLTAASARAVSGMWDAVVTHGAAGKFQLDGHHPFNGAFCQRIQHGAGIGQVGVANRGLNRWGIAVKRGQQFQGRVYLRGQSLQGSVTVALQSADGRRTYAAQRLAAIGASWRKFAFTLSSTATDPGARFALWIDHPGVVWADQAVLMGTGLEQFHGLPIRSDIAHAIVDEGVTFLRYGGTMVNVPGYRWKNMIGDPDRRPPYRGNWYPYSTNGFGIFDFLNFCEAAHLAPAFAINIEETAQDAADLADYLTAPASSPWGRRRAGDGHAAPYHIQYIEIGNEECIGADDPAAYDHYSARFQAIARAIHARHPGLKLVCAAWWRPNSPSMKRVFRAVNGEAAAWDLHVWSDSADAGRGIDRDLTQVQSLFWQWGPQSKMKAVIFEENGNLHNLQRALGHATTLAAATRHGDFVIADCPANCLQPWRQNDNGWDQGQIFFTPDRVWRMPPFYAQQMAARGYETLCVQSSVENSGDLFVSAARGKDGKSLILSVVNVGPAATEAAVSLQGFDGVKSAETWTLAGDMAAVNAPAGLEEIRPQRDRRSVRGAEFSYTFPAHSYLVMRLSR
ncbi:alpha-L-arabinofuranosidase [Capsulimonas corticalis]|uniref:non-reducing end alpha-L-arabinofuranosidase n=1 Tax=Capsulimonas corticalis TaxID=2219043 RepID=A0A402CQ38_9BACT|nr:alpha-L-arabinofuranosidase C-terminal domain-containing protein [Capsulimonas corticalis]BDI32792.1 alpha-L-arabinofuranosidase [Capsulimonas corticalis]